MKNLWAGEEVIRKHSSHREQGVCDFDNRICLPANIDDNEPRISCTFEPASFQSVHGDTNREENSLRSSITDVKGLNVQKTVDPVSPPILRQYHLTGEMASLVGTYQHERNENLDEYFKALGVPYIPRKMMGMTSPRLEITNENGKWTIRSISMMRTVELTFTLGEEYEESMPNGVTLKNVTTIEGDSLVTVSVSADNTKVVRKYDLSEDGVVLTMTHEKSGQVAKRYFKRLS